MGATPDAWRSARELAAAVARQARQAAPGSPLAPGGCSGGPPQGAAGQGPRSGAVEALSHGGLTPVKPFAPPPPPGPPPLDLTHLQLLSHAIEHRRRDRLASIRDLWEKRLDERRRGAAWYRFRADEIERELTSHQLAGTAPPPGLAVEGAIAAAAAARLARLATYAGRRVAALAGDLGPRLAECGQGERWIRCECDGGAPRGVTRRCGQRAICRDCARRFALRCRRRALAAIPGHQRDHRDQRNRPGRVRMITLTVRHSGDVATDRARLIAGWEGLRKQLHRWFGRALPFVLLVEVTPGAQHDGHVHAHVVVIGGPAFWPYAAIQRTWRAVCPHSTHLDIQLARSVAGAAGYVTKYATKSAAVVGSGWSDELTADVIAMQYGKRAVTASRGFWRPPEPICACCGTWITIAKPPDELTRVAGPGQRGPPRIDVESGADAT